MNKQRIKIAKLVVPPGTKKKAITDKGDSVGIDDDDSNGDGDGKVNCENNDIDDESDNEKIDKMKTRPIRSPDLDSNLLLYPFRKQLNMIVLKEFVLII
ncbi:hypothetical protein F8M41_017113 [Gigaspora margarita]|uniref:Uncharacterized protein n=1 Tax=Gigaspora margarita TaxID=4874 RepID=A0A8H4ANK7_GIGMA|nr:hypothetical protein F8M41_017113 [Gigaspora margarita]